MAKAAPINVDTAAMFRVSMSDGRNSRNNARQQRRLLDPLGQNLRGKVKHLGKAGPETAGIARIRKLKA